LNQPPYAIKQQYIANELGRYAATDMNIPVLSAESKKYVLAT